MGAYSLNNSPEGSATPDRGGSRLHGYQREYHQDAAANEGVGVMDLPGDLETSGQKSGAPAGTSGKRTGCQAGALEFPESLAGRHATTGQGSGGGH